MNMDMLVWSVVIVTVLGLIYGFFLAFADKKFAVEENPLVAEVEGVLPQAQCGACGYAGCHAYAEAVVLKIEVAPNLCVVGKEVVANQVAQLTAKIAEILKPEIAKVKCSGSHDKAVLAYKYEGVKDCLAANLLLGGSKACKHGCLGLGTCVSVCQFDAITMGTDGLPIIDSNKCTGCRLCEGACPRKVIKMTEVDAHVFVSCSSTETGMKVRKVCSVACIGCGLCKRQCPHGAIEIIDNIAVVNDEICIAVCHKAVCVEKCPTKAIKAWHEVAVDDCIGQQTGVQ